MYTAGPSWFLWVAVIAVGLPAAKSKKLAVAAMSWQYTHASSVMPSGLPATAGIATCAPPSSRSVP